MNKILDVFKYCGMNCEILEVGDGWVKLNVNGKAGYVKLQLLLEALTENPPDAEVKN